MARLLAALTTLLVVGLIAPAPSASADSYGPPVPTDTQVGIEIEAGVVTAVVEVRANTEGKRPRGTVDVVIETAGAAAAGGGQSVLTRDIRGSVLAAQVYADSTEYDGSPVAIQVGRLPAGTYEVQASFTPDADSNYLPSSETNEFTVGDETGDAEETVGGALPETGGPGLWWLLVALALLAAGAGAVVVGRRRTS